MAVQAEMHGSPVERSISLERSRFQPSRMMKVVTMSA